MSIMKRLLEQQRSSRSRSSRTLDTRTDRTAAVPQTDFFADIRAYNSDVRKWSIDVQKLLKQSVMRMTKKERQFFFKTIRKYEAVEKAQKRKTDELHANIKRSTRKGGMGQITRVGFKFPVHGIYLHHGVSRGHPAGNPRRKVDWFNPIILKKEKDLADIVAKFYAGALINYQSILIK